MEHYVTLFDRFFLPQGLALHASLMRNAGEFTMWVLCIDEHTKQVLDSLHKPNLRTVALADVETPELLAVKAGRSRAEYCWTLTPFTPALVFERDPQAQRVTYIDADVFLLQSPAPIFEELQRSGKAVLITDHAYDAEYDHSAASGQYCVQFVTFVRGASEPVRQWWQERCIEWCFERPENGKLGDQKYLEQWPVLFPSLVHVLEQLDVLLAPWNARRFPYSRAIAWHFHGLRLMDKGKVLLHRGYAVPEAVDRAVYLPYIQELKRSLDQLGGPVVQTVARRSPVLRLKVFAKNLLRLLNDLLGHDTVRDMPK